MSKIGVWNTAFLGDAVLTLPLLQSLKANFPQAELRFFVRGGLESLFASQPELAGAHGFDKRDGQSGLAAAYSLGRRLAREDYTLWISAHRSFRSGLISHWSGVRTRIGYSTPWFNHYCYTHTVDRAFKRFDEIERLLRLLDPLKLSRREDWPRLALNPESVERAGEFWAREIHGPVLGLHPGSTWATKRWPAERFGRVAAMAAKAGARVLLFGGPGERELAAEVEAAAGEFGPGRLINLAGELNLPDLAAWIARLDCYLGNDAGPLHLAWTQRAPVVALFGPTVRSLGFYPRGETATVLERELDCRPCGLHGPQVCPKGHHRCMLDISAEEVFAAVAGKLGLPA